MSWLRELSRDEGGVATVWTAGAMALLLLLTSGVVMVAGAQVARHSLENLTDQAALAGAGLLNEHPFAEEPVCTGVHAYVRTHASQEETEKAGSSAATVPTVVSCQLVTHPRTGLPAVQVQTRGKYLRWEVTAQATAGLIAPTGADGTE